jgi:hypothetical protein
MWTDEELEQRILRITTPEGLEQLALNVEHKSPLQAQAARRRAVHLRAATYGASSQVEVEAVEAVYAYERAKMAKTSRKFHASRTWQMIERRGIIAAVEHVVTRSHETTGYRTLVEMGWREWLSRL